MKNVHHVLRPVWSSLERWERWVIFVASIVLAAYVFLQRLLEPRLSKLVGSDWTGIVWSVIDVVVGTSVGIVAISWYKRLKVGRYYPCTFVYAFHMPLGAYPSTQNPFDHGRVAVVGYCCLSPDLEKGEITASGCSFTWENGALVERTAYNSTRVYGKALEGKLAKAAIPRCVVLFEIAEKDRNTRLYSYGLFEFELLEVTRDGVDAYVGTMRSTRKNPALPDAIGLFGTGYAERYERCIPDTERIQRALQDRGETLIERLKEMHDPKREVPPLWEEARMARHQEKNYWDNAIPTPQSVMLACESQPPLKRCIEQYLSNVLVAWGLRGDGLEAFLRLAIQEAKRDQDDDSLIYERDLKALLYRQSKQPGDKWGDALQKRATIISEAITPYLEGDSLLDIGCGDGRVAQLVKDRFSKIELVDVIDYVPQRVKQFLKLTVTCCPQGHELPVAPESYDTVLLLTVLHHARDPEGLLKQAWAATRKRLIIIESVIGVKKMDVPEGVAYGTEDLLTGQQVADQQAADEQVAGQQVAFAVFVDWFYNRVLYDDVPVPYNLTTVDNWRSVFHGHNMHVAETKHLGRDIDIAPEYHVLFVLEKGEARPKSLAATVPVKGRA